MSFLALEEFQLYFCFCFCFCFWAFSFPVIFLAQIREKFFNNVALLYFVCVQVPRRLKRIKEAGDLRHQFEALSVVSFGFCFCFSHIFNLEQKVWDLDLDRNCLSYIRSKKILEFRFWCQARGEGGGLQLLW